MSGYGAYFVPFASLLPFDRAAYVYARSYLFTHAGAVRLSHSLWKWEDVDLWGVILLVLWVKAHGFDKPNHWWNKYSPQAVRHPSKVPIHRRLYLNIKLHDYFSDPPLKFFGRTYGL